MRAYPPIAAVCLAPVLLCGPAAAAGLGAPFGARDPQVCQSIDQPAAPTPAQAADLIRCRNEVESGGELWLMKDLSVRISAPRPYDYLQDSLVGQIDPSKPVHDLRGSFTWSVCITKTSAQIAGKNPDRNCSERIVPVATGGCWLTTFGEWNCTAGGAVTEIRKETAPLN